MQRIFFVFIYFFCFLSNSIADTYPEVVFENSLVSGSYAKSTITYEGESWVENVNNRLLVSDTLFFTPGNSLSLKYLSSDIGRWEAKITYNRQKNQYRFNEGDNLSFFVFVKTKPTKISDLPRFFISLKDGSTDTISLDKYIVNFGYNKWIQVKIPCKIFKKSSIENVVSGVGFVQNNTSQVEHHIFLDQVEFLPSKFVDVKLNAPAILTDAIPYDKMVHLKWQLPLSPSIRYVKLYRSTDGKEFSPVGIRPIYMQSCLDVVPKTGGKYYYKIVLLDFNYNESPASVVKEAETKSLPNEAIVDLIQATHVNYFVENFDINSGMYIPFRSKEKAIVSTKETAGAILALIVGAERKQISRTVVLQRVSKIAYFLLKAQHKFGIFPSYFDGRKGVPEYRKGSASYDVQATASLIEALLVAREYFSSDQENEKDLRNRISALYDQIDWTAIVDQNMLLKPKFDISGDLVHDIDQVIVPLNGTNDAINTYLLAISSKRFALPTNSYFDAIYYRYGIDRIEEIEDLDIYADSVTNDTITDIGLDIIYKDSLSKKSIFSPTYKYGVSLPLGEYGGSLMDLYKPFFTINPNSISDSLVNWSSLLKTYIQYVKRRDNEYGVGTTTSDIWGFYQHKDSIGNYRVNPAIGPSAIIVDKELAMTSLMSLYKQYGHVLLGEYGFRSWLDLRNNDESDEYLAVNQAALVIMLENAKTGLIWNLYDKIPELKMGREKLFSKPVLLVD